MRGLEAARFAVDHGEWSTALGLIAECGDDAATPDGLELRALAEYGNGDFEASVSTWEDLHAALISDGDVVDAARAAAMAAMFLMMDTGLMAPVRGWLRRAERLLEGHDAVPAHAVIAMVRCYERLFCGDMDAARTWSSLAVELGERLGVDPAVMIGRVCGARVHIFDGDVQVGLELLDGIALDLMSDAVDPLTTGMMYCELICAAQGMALHDRASEWTEVMEQWRHGAAIGGISGRCRVHRAEILRVTGPCDAAEAEALGACEELRPWMRREFGWPLVELGTIRLRRGDLAGAEEAFLAAHERSWSPHPGLALLRLEQGDVEGARTMIADAIEHPFDIPWKLRPPIGDLRLVPLHDAQAEIAVAAGDAETAERSAHHLAEAASRYPSRSLSASALLAAARASLAGGDATNAIHSAKAATAAWSELGAPFEAASARMVLAEARSRSGDIDGARLEWAVAERAFDSYGATLRSKLAHRLAADPSATAASPHVTGGSPVATTAAAFRRDGDVRVIGLGDITTSVRDLKGLRYLERLLASPGREIHVSDLVAVERGSLPTGGTVERETNSTDSLGAGMPVIDAQARAAYRRRLAEVEEDIEEATHMNDLGRVELAQRDRDYLVAELSRAVGLAGRARTTGGSTERARMSVTRSIRYALGRIRVHHAALAAHLDHHVRTGTYCVYEPDPIAPLVWDL